MSDSLHPDVRQFKQFVKANPHVLRDVKSADKTLQDLFEEWKLFGEEDEIWETYRQHHDNPTEGDSEETATSEDLIAFLKKMNLNDLQHHLAQFSTVMESVQELLSQFRQNQPAESDHSYEQSPFSFRED